MAYLEGKRKHELGQEEWERKVRSGSGPPRPASSKCFGQQTFIWEYLDQFGSSMPHRAEERENWAKETKVPTVTGER